MHIKLRSKHRTATAAIAAIVTIVVITAALHDQPAGASLAATPIPGLPFTTLLPVFHHSSFPPPTPPPTSAGGLLVGWYTDNVSQASIDNLATYAQQGATQMLAYNCYHAGVDATRRYLDKAQRQGIKVWVDMRLHVLGTPPKENWQAFIYSLKDHPAVHGWYIADEPEYSGPDRATVLQYYQWTKEADPVHPVAIAHCWIVYPEFIGVYDTLIMNVYPGWSGQAAGCYDSPSEFNASIRNSYHYWLNGKSAANSYDVPIISLALGFGYYPGTTQCQGGVRDLTDKEHRWYVHVPVILGYQGALFWWDMNEGGMVQTNPHMKELVARRFAEISAIAAEMADGITNDSSVLVNEPQANLIYRHGTDDDRHVILAANVARWDAYDNAGLPLSNVQFTLPASVGSFEVEVLGEGRTLPVIDGTFTDAFAPFAVHAYAFTYEH